MVAKIGAYVWHAFAGTPSTPQAEWNLTWLGPTKWAGREPWYLQRSGTTLTGRSDTQTIRDKQIQNAFRCGLDFMAYNLVPDELGWLSSGASSIWQGASTGILLHQSSPYASLVKYCANIICGSQVQAWFVSGNISDLNTYLVSAFQDPNYLTVGAGRPVLFLYQPQNIGGASGFPAALRTACSNASLPNPYIIGDWSQIPDQTTYNSLGLDAMGMYSISEPSADNTTFASWHTNDNVASWSAVHALGNPMAPSMSCGIDWRPISDVNGAVGSYAPPGQGEANPGHYSQVPTPAQFASAIQDAVAFTVAHSALNPYGLVTVYSIGENTECVCALEPDGIDFGMRYQVMAQSLQRQRDNPRILRARGIRNNSR